MKKKRPVGRKTGYCMSEESKEKIRNTKRGINRDNTIAKYIKQVLYYTNKEKSAFDFWPELRRILKPMNQKELLSIIEREIADKKTWKDVNATKEILSQYFHLAERKE